MHHETKILAFLILSCLSLILGSSEGLAQGKISVMEGNFNILMPGQYKTYTDTIHTEIGEVVYHTLTVRDTVFNYQISYCDYPYGTVHSDSTDLLKEFYQSTIDESVVSVQGVKKYESEITQFGYPGWFWKIEFGNHKFIKTKSFVAGSRFYTLQVIGDSRKDDDQKTFAFLDSFQFMDLSKVR